MRRRDRGGRERRRHPRYALDVDVDYRLDDSYLYSRASNLSELGIFLVTARPAPRGTELELRFKVPGDEGVLEVAGEVMWVDRGGDGRQPGMGIRFLEPTAELRERIRTLIRTMAYLE